MPPADREQPLEQPLGQPPERPLQLTPELSPEQLPVQLPEQPPAQKSPPATQPEPELPPPTTGWFSGWWTGRAPVPVAPAVALPPSSPLLKPEEPVSNSPLSEGNHAPPVTTTSPASSPEPQAEPLAVLPAEPAAGLSGSHVPNGTTHLPSHTPAPAPEQTHDVSASAPAQAVISETWAEWANPVRRMSSVVSTVGMVIPRRSVDPAAALVAAETAVVPRSSTGTVGHHALPATIVSMPQAGGPATDIPTPAAPLHVATVPTQALWFLWLTRDPPAVPLAPLRNAQLAAESAQAIRSATGGASAYAVHTRGDGPEEVAVLGTGSAEQPVRMSQPVPELRQELQERLLGGAAAGAAATATVVAPTVAALLRKRTLKTQARLLLEHAVGTLRETHLYRAPRESHVPLKVVVVGIHGFFPIKMVRALIGQPTGTLAKFATMAAAAFETWGREHNRAVDVQLIALEGEGRIEERVGQLLQLLENWAQLIRECDVLMFAAHSQGVPVAVQMVAELAQRGDLAHVHKVGMVNMAGVCVGPFAGLDSKLVVRAYSTLETDITHELFGFQSASSEVLLRLARALRVCVAHNVKLAFVGSLNDQLIPLYLLLAMHVRHPNVFRSVYMDEACDAPEFVRQLVRCAVVSLNVGHSDHGVVAELLRHCAGTLTGGGHSRIYACPDVYLQGIEHLMGTTSLVRPQPLRTVPVDPLQAGANPYHLPWCVRGWIDEFVRTPHIGAAALARSLSRSFREWEPAKQWRDVHASLDCVGVLPA